MNYKLNLNLQNFEIDQKAVYRWSNASAHEGVTLVDGTQVQGFQWTDRTLERVDIPELMKVELKSSSSLNEGFQKTAQQLGSEFQSTIEAVAESDNFDYQAIKNSQTLSFE
ncbi:hypothetical protein LEP3755_34140 [Leptolyngbya sp. NIES-3755]|nr:hypothetical protein LEP3755_34140 [Leptolyngbya sp. NIES-3755]